MVSGEKKVEENEKEPDRISIPSKFDALISKEMNSKNLPNVTVENLLEKCEVKSFGEIYLRKTFENDGIYAHKKLFDYSNTFSVEKVQADISNMDSLIMVRLLNPKPLKKSSYDFELQTPPQDRKEIQQEFEKPYYLLNEQGLRRILSLYLKRKVLGPIISFSEIMNEFELPSKKIPVLLNMLQNLIKTKKIYADLLESNTGKMEDMKLIFTSKMKDPLNKKKMLGILFMTFIVIISVILYNHFFGFTI